MGKCDHCLFPGEPHTHGIQASLAVNVFKCLYDLIATACTCAVRCVLGMFCVYVCSVICVLTGNVCAFLLQTVAQMVNLSV